MAKEENNGILNGSQGVKRCPTCGTLKALNEFCRSRNGKQGINWQCKACAKEAYQQNKRKYEETRKTYKECNKDKLKAYQGLYRETHKDETKQYGKQYRENNRQKIKERQKRYYQEMAQVVKVNAKQQYEEKKDEIKALHVVYRKTSKGAEVVRKATAKRRAIKQKSKIEDFTHKAIFERDNYKCQLCGKKTRPEYSQYHPSYPNLDHIVPLFKGGDHTKLNTQCVCKQCNAIKGAEGKGDQLRMFG